MVFLISLGLALLFVLLCRKPLRAHPVPFYIGAAAIALAVVIVTWSGVALPPVFSEYIWPVFARRGLAGALFVVVMFTGAFPNGSRPIKVLMPIRGQLSILASILTLGHNAAYGRVYFVRLFIDPASLPINQLLAAACSVLMLLIMLPLFITSFQRVRRKMAPKTWKRLQRWAYGFYGLLCCHILLLTVPAARQGSPAYQLTVFIYGTVFLAYLDWRVGKAIKKGGRHPGSLAKRRAVSALCCMAVPAVAVLGMGAPPEPPAPAAVSSQPSSSATDGYTDGVYTGSAMG